MVGFDDLQEQLQREGFEATSARLDGHRAIFAQKRTFRWLWFGTALWENVVVVESGSIDAPEIAALIEQATTWAVGNKKGLPRGMQSGQAIVVIVHAREVSPEARDVASKSWTIKFGQFTLAAITDGKTPTIPRGPLLVGVIYKAHLKRRMQSLV